ncbi:nicotinate dehydrogenase subunit A [Streptosporangium subroseum]|uniref:Nicotinate dehydrogenase subunit A n=2 Tax=Streptosporangium subroseum TaxID=106412 RepID=A0A239L0E3_9ACTN|nr:nicotinate dehydrogenase subunit A [Streptosporangium subroseum]
MTVNGVKRSVGADAETSLLHVLREDLGLKGPRFGCGAGLCGACLVLLDGYPTPSCDTPLWAAEGKDVVTVEGLGDLDSPHPLQQAFLDEQAGQCGYCLSGILISAAALLTRNPAPDEREVAEALDRNLCRCGAQRRMIRAVMRAAKEHP